MSIVENLTARINQQQVAALRVAAAYTDEENFWAPAVVVNAGALVNPSDVLADVAAKRAILELHHETTVWIDSEAPNGERCKEPDYVCGECEDEFPCKTLRLLASAYPDRKPDSAAEDR